MVSSQCASIVPIAPQILLLAVAGLPSRRRKAKGQEDEDVVPALGSKLDVKIWPPHTNKDHPKAQSKVANERPIEG